MKRNWKTIPVGGCLTHAHIIYQLKEGWDCEKCAFMYDEEAVCCAPSRVWRQCSRHTRADGKECYFVRVGEE